MFERPEWRMAGTGGFRRLSPDAVESFGGPGLYWYAANVFRDFRLLVDWRILKLEDNSGIFLRIPPLKDDIQPAIDRGYEVQIDDRGLDPESKVLGSPLHLTGAIYRLAPARRHGSRPVGEWNSFDIVCRGSSIAVTLNGEEISSFDTAAREAEGHIALQAHHTGSTVQFRALHVMPLPSRYPVSAGVGARGPQFPP